MKQITTSILTFMFSFCWADGGKQYLSARHHGLGGSSLNLRGTLVSLENIATMSFLESVHVGTAFHHHYLLSELNHFGIGAIVPTRLGAFGFEIDRMGSTLYNEHEFSIAYAQTIGEKTALGAKVNYLRLQQEAYGSANAISVELGLTTQLTPEFHLGAHIYNPTRTKLNGENNTQTDGGLRLGILYQLPKVNLLLETEASSISRLAIKTGAEWMIHPHIYARLGGSYPTSEVTGGLGLKLSKLSSDVYVQYHFLLGMSTGIALNYVF